MDLPFISVIIPAYNRAKLVVNAIQSLIDQDYPKNKYEVVIVDNNSSDNTIEEIERFVRKQKVNTNLKYVLEKRQGLVYSRHTGAMNAIGEILLYGDDDGLYDKNWISAVSEVYVKYPNIGAVGTRIKIKWDKTPPKWVIPHEDVLGKLSYGEGITVKEGIMHINGGSFSIKKEILLQMEGFNIGQVGDIMFGDCESGLCRKLFRNKIAIGFTDKTTMWHLQFKDIQGNYRNLKRRYKNNGISEAYNLVFIQKQVNYKNIKHQMSKLRFKILKSFLKFWNRSRYYSNLLNYYRLVWCKKYLSIYTSETDVLNKVKTTDWILNKNYIYPSSKILMKYD